MLFGEGESSEDEDFNRKKKPKTLEQSLTSTLECLSEDAEFWKNNVINKKRNSDQAVSAFHCELPRMHFSEKLETVNKTTESGRQTKEAD